MKNGNRSNSSGFSIAPVVVGIPVIYILLGVLGVAGIKNVFPQRAYLDLTISENNLGEEYIEIINESGKLGHCVEPREIGCVHVPSSRKAHISYRLENMDGWKFKRIQLVAEQEAEPFDKLNFGDQDGFTDDMAADFYVKINNQKVHPDTNGIIYLAGLQKGDKFKLVDRNKYPPRGESKQVYKYQIEACNDDTDECLWTDPKIENEGDN